MNSRKKDQKRSKGGGSPRLYFSLATEAGGTIKKDAIVPGKNRGEFDIKITIALDHQYPRFAVPAKILVNGEVRAIMPVQHPQERTLSEIKPNSDGNIIITVAKASDQPDRGLTHTITAKELQRAQRQKITNTPRSSTPRFSILIHRRTSDNMHPVTLQCRDENGDPRSGTITVEPYKLVDCEDFDTEGDGNPTLLIPASGTLSTMIGIRKDVRDHYEQLSVVFFHVESKTAEKRVLRGGKNV